MQGISISVSVSVSISISISTSISISIFISTFISMSISISVCAREPDGRGGEEKGGRHVVQEGRDRGLEQDIDVHV